MDPDANLAEQRKISKTVLATVDREDFEQNHAMQVDVVERAIRLSELCEALDEWIMKRGALPTDWYVAQRENSQTLK